MSHYQRVLSSLLFVSAALSLSGGATAQAEARDRSPSPATIPMPEPPLVWVPTLALHWGDDSFSAVVGGPSEFWGVVLLSLDDQMQHFYVELPPILANGVVLGAGLAKDGTLAITVPRDPGPKFAVWGQALIVVDGVLSSSPVVASGVQPDAKKE